MTTRIFATIYILVGIAAGYLLATIPPPAKTPERPQPAAETCPPVNGWSSTIEPAVEGGWACVMRKGRVTKAFFY